MDPQQMQHRGVEVIPRHRIDKRLGMQGIKINPMMMDIMIPSTGPQNLVKPS